MSLGLGDPYPSAQPSRNWISCVPLRILLFIHKAVTIVRHRHKLKQYRQVHIGDLLRTLSTLFSVLFAFMLLGTLNASADTIDFTVTINSTALADPVIPLGTVYTGFVQYDGSFSPDSSSTPPTLTSYAFNFPGSPAAMSGLAFEFVQHQIGQPLFVGLEYTVLDAPYASYDLINQNFAVYTALETNGEYLTNDAEYGTVQYTYVPDPAATSEPSSLLLLATGTLAGVGFIKSRKRCSEPLNESSGIL
jgi:hypothetical protein